MQNLVSSLPLFSAYSRCTQPLLTTYLFRCRKHAAHDAIYLERLISMIDSDNSSDEFDDDFDISDRTLKRTIQSSME